MEAHSDPLERLGSVTSKKYSKIKLSNMVFKSLFLIAAGLAAVIQGYSDGVFFCYYGSWANKRSGIGRFGVSDLPANLCTHIIYSFVTLNSTGDLIIPTQEVIGNKSNKIEDLMKLKEINTNLKIMVAIGGWDEGSANFSAVVNNDRRRGYFVNNLVTLLDTYGFDGLDLDWEYPSQREGSASTDKGKFVELAKELKAKFVTKGYLLTSAVPVTQKHIYLSYNVTTLSKYIDYFNLMLYDYHGSWDITTGVNAPLYAQLTDKATSDLNVNSSVNTWISNGALASKLVLGMGLYGKTFTLISLNDTGTGAPVSGVGTSGANSKEVGTYAYYEIYEDQEKNARYWNITQVDNSYVYANNNTFWVGYDNVNTIKSKGQFAKTMGMAGIMVWAVDLDDFRGISGTKFPLIKAAIDGWNNN